MPTLVRNVIKERSDWATRHYSRSVHKHQLKVVLEYVLLGTLALALVTRFDTISNLVVQLLGS
jgi:hypothetical protein